jgi:nitric oxide synthase-interacting protein
MGRKAKQPGGHNPLTYHEARRLTYGTQTTRLGTDSQRKFGYCCLGLEPAKDPVVTPSGHVYSREAIVSYLLAKTKELKEEQAALEARRVVKERLQEKEEQISAQQKYMEFLQKDQGTIQYSQATHSKALTARLQKDICIDSKGEKRKQLAKTSYWLADFNPEVVSTTLTVPTTASTDDIHKRVPRRPTSPMTGQPLRLKDLVSIKLHREDNSTSLSSPDNVRFMCPVSGKVITHQAVIAIRKVRPRF